MITSELITGMEEYLSEIHSPLNWIGRDGKKCWAVCAKPTRKYLSTLSKEGRKGLMTVITEGDTLDEALKNMFVQQNLT